MNQTMMWNSKVTGIINNVHFLQKKMDQQKVKPPAKPSMHITQEDIDQQIAEDLDEILGKFDAVRLTSFCYFSRLTV